MARKRPRLPWSRGATSAAADVSFFDSDPRRGPRPDSPEVSVFTPAEEAESHRRWKRAVLRERFSGPLSGAERLGFGLSAAALAALAIAEREAGTDEDADAGRRDDDAGIDPEGAAGVFAALKSAAMNGGANKPAVAAKPAGTAAHAFQDTDEDSAVANPISSRTDHGGFGARRFAAPRGGGAPLEGRAAGGAERVEVTVLRKAEQATGEAAARAPLPSDGAASAAVRAPGEAQAVTMAIAMAFELPEVREDRPAAETKGANGAAPRANQAQASAEAAAAQAKAKDAPPAAEAKADARPGPAVEAAVREKAGDAPSAAAGAKNTADHGRGAAEAPGRAKAGDGGGATGTAAVSEAGADRKGSAAEAPVEVVEAKAKDVASTVGAEAGLGHKPAKVLAQARAVEIEVLETKAAVTDRGAADPHGTAKAKDAPLVVEAKAEAAHQTTAQAPEQTAAKVVPGVVETGAVQPNGSVLTSALSQTKATNAPAAAATAEKAGAAHGPADALPAAQAAKAPAPAEKAAQQQLQGSAVEAPIPDKKAAPASGEAKVETALQPATVRDASAAGNRTDPNRSTIEASEPAAKDTATVVATKTDAGRDHVQAPGQVKAAEVLPAAPDAKAGQAPGAPAEVVATQTKAKDSLAAGTKSDPGHASAETSVQAAPKDAFPAAAETKVGLDHPGPPEAAKPGKAAEALPAAGPKLVQELDTQAEAPSGKASTKDVPAVTTVEADLAHRQAEPTGPTKAAQTVAAVAAADPPKAEQAPAPPPPPVEPAGPAKAAQTVAEPAGPAKQAALPAQAYESAPHGDVSVKPVPAVLPVLDTLAIDFKDAWTAGQEASGPSQSYALPTGKAAAPILHVTDLMGTTGAEQGKATVLPAESGLPKGGTIALVPDASGGKGVPETVSVNGNASLPAQKATDATPAGTAVQEATKVGPDHATPAKTVAVPPGDAAVVAGGAVLPSPVVQEKTVGQALTLDEALAVLSGAASSDGAHQGAGPMGKGSALEHLNPYAPALDGALPPSVPHHDTMLF